jgi:hypothetical protein
MAVATVAIVAATEVGARAQSNYSSGRPVSEGLGTAVLTGIRDGMASVLAGEGIGAVAGRLTRGGTVTVTHVTSTKGAALIEESGALQAGSYVTTPGEVAGKGAAAIESLLEVDAGKGAMQATFRIPANILKAASNGSTTSGGALQWQTKVPIRIEPGTFTPTP